MGASQRRKLTADYYEYVDIPIVVEACANLAHAAWVPLQSLNLTNGAFYFSDPNWTNYSARLYRLRSP